MAVIGTYATDAAFDKLRIAAMSRQTVQESLDALQEQIRRRTPVGGPYGPYMISEGHRSGKLRDSIMKSGVRRLSTNVYQGEVYSELEYAAAIEYGMSPRKITAEGDGELKWYYGSAPQYAKTVEVSGYLGQFMFQRGARYFETHQAHDIAANNARVYLHAVDAGRRTAII